MSNSIILIIKVYVLSYFNRVTVYQTLSDSNNSFLTFDKLGACLWVITKTKLTNFGSRVKLTGILKRSAPRPNFVVKLLSLSFCNKLENLIFFMNEAVWLILMSAL